MLKAQKLFKKKENWLKHSMSFFVSVVDFRMRAKE